MSWQQMNRAILLNEMTHQHMIPSLVTLNNRTYATMAENDTNKVIAGKVINGELYYLDVDDINILRNSGYCWHSYSSDHVHSQNKYVDHEDFRYVLSGSEPIKLLEVQSIKDNYYIIEAGSPAYHSFVHQGVERWKVISHYILSTEHLKEIAVIESIIRVDQNKGELTARWREDTGIRQRRGEGRGRGREEQEKQDDNDTSDDTKPLISIDQSDPGISSTASDAELKRYLSSLRRLSNKWLSTRGNITISWFSDLLTSNLIVLTSLHFEDMKSYETMFTHTKMGHLYETSDITRKFLDKYRPKALENVGDFRQSKILKVVHKGISFLLMMRLCRIRLKYFWSLQEHDEWIFGYIEVAALPENCTTSTSELLSMIRTLDRLPSLSV